MEGGNSRGPIYDPDGWNVHTLRQMLIDTNASLERYLDSKFESNEKLLNERYSTQTKALDAAFSAASKAVETALLSAKDASTTAEGNAQQRFESFRVEIGAQVRSLAEKLDEYKSSVDARIGELTKRMDLNQGQGFGTDKNITNNRLAWGQAVGTGAFVISAIALLVHIFFT